ncbi:type IV secretory system conjugative DNA transfer family protein [Dyadobacter pollutisoli]|uniref:TraM recognition domain-containing protein n=1 Tax=Dyadobacter pollutisoli TaxID=2910158 RepID=A0A9E8SLK8_9BACT|nr:TraM recognition domain-containing protein [Dyadobacter pollutisoli]WAC11896.1 TraM recognition domain-containing protein [Dyadobacter pollutisoli]
MNPFDLDRPIIELASSNEKSSWTLRHAVEGVQIFGGIGSGKTSGSGRMLALKYLSAGFGGLVLTVKPDEKQAWQQYCKIANREKDLICIEPGGDHSFNFLQYVSANADGKDAITENIVDVLKTVIRAGDSKGGGKTDDAFWETALDLLIFNVIDLCRLAYGKVSIQQMYDIVLSVPKSQDGVIIETPGDENKAFQKALRLASRNVVEKIDAWEKSQSDEFRERMMEDPTGYEAEMFDAVPQSRVLRFVDQFFTDNLITLNEKTRSIIDFSFSGFLFRLLREPIYSLFCKYGSTVTPEDSLNGKIILLNLPVKIYHKVGRDCQVLFKYIWQQAMEKRNVNENSRPMFLWADEAQNFLHEHDASYQATARSSRIATVYISQNLPNYFASMGGEKSEQRVKSFLGTLSTKIFHANADIETNSYASNLIGKIYFINESDQTGLTQQYSKSVSKSVVLEHAVRSEQLIQLKTGGPQNKFIVEGYMHRQGDTLFGNRNHLKMNFNQNYQP